MHPVGAHIPDAERGIAGKLALDVEAPLRDVGVLTSAQEGPHGGPQELVVILLDRVEGRQIGGRSAVAQPERKDASMLAVPAAMKGKPRVVGQLVAKELDILDKLLSSPPRPFYSILGGAKVSDKIGFIKSLLGLVDRCTLVSLKGDHEKATRGPRLSLWAGKTFLSRWRGVAK